MMKQKKFIFIIIEIICWIFSFVVLIPFALVVINSLKIPNESQLFNLKLPSEFHWQNYSTAFVQGKILRGFFNSLIAASISTVLSNIAAAMAAFVLARSVNKFNKAMYSYFFLGLVAVTNYVTTVFVMSSLKLTSSLLGIILLFAAQGISFSLLLFFGFIKGLPRELDEAACIDGCKGTGLFFKIIFPLLKPVTITGMVLNFMGAWNDFVTPLYVLNNSKTWGMILSMYNVYGQFSSPYSKDWGLICAVIVMTLIPVIVLYLIGQKYIISGMTAGAVKG